MGSFFTKVQEVGTFRIKSPFKGLSLSKIRELHGSFRSICDNFAINLNEFQKIFAQNERCFATYDTDENGLVDALELFSGLIILSDAQAEDKIRCKLTFVSL